MRKTTLWAALTVLPGLAVPGAIQAQRPGVGVTAHSYAVPALKPSVTTVASPAGRVVVPGVHTGNAGPAAVAAQSRSRRSHVWTGAAAGFVIGAGGTWLLLHQGDSRSICNRDTNQDAIRPRECAALTAVGGAVGAGIGALIGSRIPAGRSGDSSVDRLRVGVAPKSGLTLGLVLPQRR